MLYQRSYVKIMAETKPVDAGLSEQKKYDVFISYSRKDYVDEQKRVIPGNEVSKIKEALTAAGITFWFDEEGIYSGDNFVDNIVTNIESSKIFVYLSTAHSNTSSWTTKEIACADEFGKRIIPVRIDKTPYNKKVMFRIADLSYIDYADNPEKGRQELIRSIKAHLAEEKAAVARKEAEERRRQEEIERQRHQQEEEKRRQERISKLEAEFSAKESRLTELRKIVLTKELELKAAKVDMDACVTELQRLQQKLEELRNPQAAVEAKRKAAEEEVHQRKLRELEHCKLSPVHRDGNWGFADDSGKVVIQCQWKSVCAFSEGLAVVEQANGKFGYIDKAGELVVPCQWEVARSFSEGLALVKDNIGGYGYIDITGTVVIPCQWKDAGRFSEGFAKVLDNNEEYGFIDKTGNVAIPCQWKDAWRFTGGLAKVQDENGEWWKIDKTGKVVGKAK